MGFDHVGYGHVGLGDVNKESRTVLLFIGKYKSESQQQLVRIMVSCLFQTSRARENNGDHETYRIPEELGSVQADSDLEACPKKVQDYFFEKVDIGSPPHAFDILKDAQ